MTLHEMWERMLPYRYQLHEFWLGLDKEDLILTQPFTIAFMREVEHFMTNDGVDDYNDDVEGLGDVDPKFMLDSLVEASKEDDHAAEIFISDYSTGYEYFNGLVNQIIRDWRERNGKRDN